MKTQETTADLYVKFLPSEFGRGFTATIRPDLGSTPNGWHKWCGHLKGVAEYPAEWFQHQAWAIAVVNSLRFQGVEFV